MCLAEIVGTIIPQGPLRQKETIAFCEIRERFTLDEIHVETSVELIDCSNEVVKLLSFGRSGSP